MPGLVDDVRGDVSGDDLAEDAVRLGCAHAPSIGAGKSSSACEPDRGVARGTSVSTNTMPLQGAGHGARAGWLCTRCSTRTRVSSSCTPRTGARWCGSRCCRPRHRHRRRGRAGRVRGHARPLVPARDPEEALAYLRRRRQPLPLALRHRAMVDGMPDTRCVLALTPPGRTTTKHSQPRPARDAVLKAVPADLPPRQRGVPRTTLFRRPHRAAFADALGISTGAVKSHALHGAAALRTPPGRRPGKLR